MTHTSKAVSKGGVICTPHRQASKAGLAILDAGGTAIDTALAASAALCATFPHMKGLGGDAMWLLSDGRKVDAILGLGQAGQRLPDAGGITERGPASAATTAGALRSWSLAQNLSCERWGSRLDWPDLLASAIDLADQGTEVSGSQVFWQHQRSDLIAGAPDLQRISYDETGQFRKEGSTLCQPELAETLRQLTKGGVDDFYDGDVANALAKGFESLGNGLTIDDLRQTRAELVKPIKIRYCQGSLFNMPPPSQGVYTLRALHALDRVQIGAMENGGADYYHYLVEAIKLQLKNRNQELCDPVFSDADLTAHLSAAQADEDFAQIDPGQASFWREPAHPADTVWFAATDRHGRTACVIQSLFHDFGSGCFVGDTGVLWLNRAAGFNADPQHPNAWAPGKRVAHTLNPSCYLADSGKQFYFGTQGGDGQPQTQMTLATQLVDYSQSLEAALHAPRFLQGRSFFGSTENLKLEETVDKAVASELEKRGHDVEWLPELSPFSGQAGVIRILPDGRREAMHDPRGEGVQSWAINRNNGSATMIEMIIACVVLGIVAGILAGMLGIGGGVVIVPALVIILSNHGYPAEYVVISAVATSLCTIIFTSISAARAQIKRKAVDWGIFKRWALLVVIGSFLSGFIAGQLPPVVLEIGIAAFLLIVSIIMLSKWVPNPSRSMPGTAGTSFLGLFSGTLSGLAGIGGGNVMVPLMVFFNVPMQRAVATSSALGLPLALVGTIGYLISGWQLSITEWSVGYVYLPAVAAIALFTVILAPVGVALSHHIPAPTLKRCFGALLMLVALRMLYNAL